MEQEKTLYAPLESPICEEWKPMEVYTVEIPMKLPSINEYIKALNLNRYAGAKFKKEIEEEISLYIKDLPRFTEPIRIDFLWIESNKRRDYDNIAFGKKFILDALVKAGKLKDDNRRFVVGFSDSFDYQKENKVILKISVAK